MTGYHTNRVPSLASNSKLSVMQQTVTQETPKANAITPYKTQAKQRIGINQPFQSSYIRTQQMKFTKPSEDNTKNLAAKKLEALQRQQQENLEKQKQMKTGEAKQQLVPLKQKSSNDARIVGTDFPAREEEMYPDIQVQTMNIDKMPQPRNDDMNMEFSVSSSYPAISNKYFYHKSKKLMHNQPLERLSRSSFMSNGTFEQLKFDQHSRHSSLISNVSGGSKSSKLKRLRRDGKMNLIEQKNAFVQRRHTQEDSMIQSRNISNHINLGMNLMVNDPKIEYSNPRDDGF